MTSPLYTYRWLTQAPPGERHTQTGEALECAMGTEGSKLGYMEVPSRHPLFPHGFPNGVS